MTSLKVRGDDGSVFLLSRRVPDVQFGWLPLQGDIFHLEINCGDEGAFLRMELSFDEPPKQCSFAHVTIAHQNELVFLLFPEG